MACELVNETTVICVAGETVKRLELHHASGLGKTEKTPHAQSPIEREYANMTKTAQKDFMTTLHEGEFIFKVTKIKHE
jgi:hypothetical protein